MSEKILNEELLSIRNAQNKAALAKSEAEKSVAIAKIAELEVSNTILSVYNKYGLRAGVDSIKEDGTILRQETPEVVPTEEVVNG